MYVSPRQVRLPEIWKIPASCWANWTLHGESDARCDSPHPPCSTQYWSLRWLCWMLIVWEEPSTLEIPNVGQATLRHRATIYLLSSPLPLLFQGPCPGPGAECTFWPRGLLQSAASVAELSQFSIACRRERRAPQKNGSKREIANIYPGGMEGTAKVVLWKKVGIPIQSLPGVISQEIPLMDWH